MWGYGALLAKAGADGLNLDTMDSLGPFVVPPSQSKPDLWWQSVWCNARGQQNPSESAQYCNSDAAWFRYAGLSSGDAGDCILQCGTEGGVGICCLFLSPSAAGNMKVLPPPKRFRNLDGWHGLKAAFEYKLNSGKPQLRQQCLTRRASHMLSSNQSLDSTMAFFSCHLVGGTGNSACSGK